VLGFLIPPYVPAMQQPCFSTPAQQGDVQRSLKPGKLSSA
jgi:hypothetical protein